MNKRQIIQKIAREACLTQTQAAKALDSFLDGVRASLSEGRRVTLVGFGTFAISQRKARLVRDPQHGGTMRIEARRVARFAPGNELRSAIERSALPARLTP